MYSRIDMYSVSQKSSPPPKKKMQYCIVIGLHSAVTNKMFIKHCTVTTCYVKRAVASYEVDGHIKLS